jgi:hypothetical protein
VWLNAYDGSTVKAYDGSMVKAWYGSKVYAHDGSTVKAWWGSTVNAFSGSRVNAYDGSTVKAWYGSKVRDFINGEWPERGKVKEAQSEDLTQQMNQLSNLQSAEQTAPHPISKEQLVEALTDAWGEWLGDTHTIPGCFSIHGPRTVTVTADFTAEPNFIESVLWRLNSNASAHPSAARGDGTPTTRSDSARSTTTPDQAPDTDIRTRLATLQEQKDAWEFQCRKNAAGSDMQITAANRRYDALQAKVSEQALIKLVKHLWGTDPTFASQEMIGAQKLIDAIISTTSTPDDEGAT